MRFFGRRRSEKRPVPNGVFRKCDGCGEMVYAKNVEERLQVCPACDYHFRIGAWDRVKLHTDEGSFREMDAELTSCDPLAFVSDKVYAEQIAGDRKKTNLNEAVVYGPARIDGRDVVFAAMDFSFRGGNSYTTKTTTSEAANPGRERLRLLSPLPLALCGAMLPKMLSTLTFVPRIHLFTSSSSALRSVSRPLKILICCIETSPIVGR